MIVAAAGLSALHIVTDPKIAEARAAAFEDAMERLFDGENYIPSVLGENVFEVYDAEDDLIGFAIRISLRGLGGPVHMAVGVSTLLEVTGVEVLSHRETGDISQYIERGSAEALLYFERGMRT
jgi:Na+-translocating ferredoxin:NAD+ oxidoreductase RnfG subunit